jgi:hypothetical protein
MREWAPREAELVAQQLLAAEALLDAAERVA